MKIPEPRKLPSGNWFIQIRMDGRSISITDDNRDRCIARAMAVKTGILEERKHPASITLGKAIDQYIENRAGVLSPSTITGYRKIRRNCVQEIMDIKLHKLTAATLQRAVSSMSAAGASPKYVRNVWGLVKAAILEAVPDFNLGKIKLPQKERYSYAIPTPEDIRKILNAAQGSNVELPILLAVWLGLRMSEIRGLKWGAIKDGVVHICTAIVETEDGPVEKGTKSYTSDRYIKLPEYIINALDRADHSSEYVVPLSYGTIYHRFERLCSRLDLSTHYRFHDLRHVQASVGLALGVPNKYMQERMGHATDNMLKSVYQHTMQGKASEYADAIDAYFDSMVKR